jgi:N-acetyl-anhydromuramoyl-L-alanine amidase
MTPLLKPDSHTSASTWHDGWYAPAQRLESPNQGLRPDGTTVDLVVLHSISLPPGEYGGGFVQQLFTNQLDGAGHPYFESIKGLQVSAHFFIARDGQLWQFVSTWHRAWHAGPSSLQGRDNCNDFSIGIELEGLEGQHFEPAQYHALAGLCTALAQQHPIAHIAGHEHIAPGRKRDPGSGFEWPRLQAALGWPVQRFSAITT